MKLNYCMIDDHINGSLGFIYTAQYFVGSSPPSGFGNELSRRLSLLLVN